MDPGCEAGVMQDGGRFVMSYGVLCYSWQKL